MGLRDKLMRFMYGRYGADQLWNALFGGEIVLLFVATVLNIIGKAAPAVAVISGICYLLALGLLIYAMFRFFSRNIPQRRRENEVWLRFAARFKRKKKPSLPPDTPTHIFRSCPKCCSTLRLPRQEGKHQVKCPRCGERFGIKVK